MQCFFITYKMLNRTFFILNKTIFPPSYHRIMRKGPLYMLLPIWEMQKLLNYLFYLVCSVPVNGKQITLCTSK